MTFSKKSPLSQARLDLWLWAARFYKTRNIAASNIKKGMVRIYGKSTTKPSSLLNEGSQLLIKQNYVRKTILVKEIAVKRVPFEKAKNFYKITCEDPREVSMFFKTRTKYKPDKKMRRNLKSLKEKLHFLSDN